LPQIELGIGRVAEDLGVDARKLRRRAGIDSGRDGLRRARGGAKECRGDKRRDGEENTLHGPSAHTRLPAWKITARKRFA